MDKFVAEIKETLLMARIEALERFLQEKFPDAKERLGYLMVEASKPRRGCGDVGFPDLEPEGG